MDEQNAPASVPAIPHRLGSKKFFISAGLILVIVLLGYYVFKILNAPRYGGAAAQANQLGAGETNVVQTKPATIPEGFPPSIPVETANITDGYKIEYKTYGVTQYTVSYTSADSQANIWKAYSGLMLAQGYAVDQKVSKPEQGFIAGKRTDKELNVSINPSKTAVYVTVNYVERK